MAVQPCILIPPEGAEPADEWVRLAAASHNAGKYEDAETQLRQALRLDPRCPAALNNLAAAYACGGDKNLALLAADRAILLGPREGDNAAVIRANKALIAVEAKRFGEALEAVQAAVQLAGPEATKACHLAAAHVYGAAGFPDRGAYYYDLLVEQDPKHFPAGQNSCFAYTLTDTPTEVGMARRRTYVANHRQESKAGPLHRPSLNGKPIRVGYVSGDYKRHSASMIWGAVALNHSPRFEPYFYSTMAVDPKTDAYTKKFQDYIGSRWRDLAAVDDDQAEATIRKDRIDILVDLAGHTGGGRLPLFTRRCAPVQVTAWGFAHGTGCDAIDYFLADPVAVPENERQHFSEKVIDLPCIVTYMPPTEYGLKGVSKPPCDRNGHFTFGCYCRWEKVSEQYLEAVRQILLAVPQSRMIFKDDAYSKPWCCQRVIKQVCDYRSGDGRLVNPDRIDFCLGTSHPDHLLAYQQSDLILDPFPHSGGAAALEQLYMGVPLVTLYGKQAAGRTAASILTAMNRRMWVAEEPDGYVAKACWLAGQRKVLWDADQLYGPRILADARKILRQELLDSPVCKGYVGAVEAAYESMIKEKAACSPTT